MEKVCRICGDLVQHSESVRMDEYVERTSIGQMLSYCTKINIYSCGNVSSVVCGKCKNDLLIAYKLIVLYHKTSERWEELIAQRNIQSPTVQPITPATKIVTTNAQEQTSTTDTFPTDCSTCGESFGNTWDLKEHRRLACGMDDSIFQRWSTEQVKCCGCSATFDSPELLRAHSKSVHKPAFEATNDPLHADRKQFVCNICFRRYTSRSILLEHKQRPYRAKHYQCARCGRAFRDKYSLDDHERAHGDERPFVCGTCSKTFVLKESYRKHVRLHTFLPDRFKCDMCGKGFRTNGNLKEHRVTHASIKSLQCPHCSSQFTRKSCLKSHMRLHTGEKPFKCDRCDATFTFPSDLRRHVMAHSGIKPFHCDMCKKAYPRKDYLVKHIASVHPESRCGKS